MPDREREKRTEGGIQITLKGGPIDGGGKLCILFAPKADRGSGGVYSTCDSPLLSLRDFLQLPVTIDNDKWTRKERGGDRDRGRIREGEQSR